MIARATVSSDDACHCAPMHIIMHEVSKIVVFYLEFGFYMYTCHNFRAAMIHKLRNLRVAKLDPK